MQEAERTREARLVVTAAAIAAISVVRRWRRTPARPSPSPTVAVAVAPAGIGVRDARADADRGHSERTGEQAAGGDCLQTLHVLHMNPCNYSLEQQRLWSFPGNGPKSLRDIRDRRQ